MECQEMVARRNVTGGGWQMESVRRGSADGKCQALVTDGKCQVGLAHVHCQEGVGRWKVLGGGRQMESVKGWHMESVRRRVAD